MIHSVKTFMLSNIPREDNFRDKKSLRRADYDWMFLELTSTTMMDEL